MSKKPDLQPLNIIKGALRHVAANPDDKRAPEDRLFDWNLSTEDTYLIAQIIQRARDDAAFHGAAFDLGIATLDIITAHNMCGGLHLQRWLMSDRADFINDFVGIAANIDRRAGVLLNDWRPIFAKARN